MTRLPDGVHRGGYYNNLWQNVRVDFTVIGPNVSATCHSVFYFMDDAENTPTYTNRCDTWRLDGSHGAGRPWFYKNLEPSPPIGSKKCDD